MRARVLVAWPLIATIVLTGSVAAHQKARRPRSETKEEGRERADPSKAKRDSATREAQGELMQSGNPKQGKPDHPEPVSQSAAPFPTLREAATRRKLEERLGHPPAETEVAAELAREDRPEREAEEKREAASRRREEEENREFERQSADISNFIVTPATTPPPANVRVKIRKQRKGQLFEFSRAQLEKKIRSMSASRTGQFHTAFSAFDAAVFTHVHGMMPSMQPLRYLRYDPETGSLSVYSDASRRAAPERTWKLPPPEESLTDAEIRVYLRSSRRVIFYGSEVPEAFRQSSTDTGIEYVRGAERSANATPDQHLAAAGLGDGRLDPARAELLDGLPNIREGILGLWDTLWMNLPFSARHEWRDFRRDIELPRGVPSRPATARNVTEGLTAGTQDILLVVAHNDGDYLYLPSRERIKLRDIAALTRAEPPDRVVVLITCKGALRQEGLASSLAEMILILERLKLFTVKGFSLSCFWYKITGTAVGYIAREKLKR